MKKREAIQLFSDHVSSGKAGFYKRYWMNFVMGEREGPWLSDIDGKKQLLNLHCNGGVFNLGHRPRFLVDVLKRALDELDIGNHHLMSAERALTAKALADLMPEDLDYVIFGAGGGEAIDTAIKVARAHTGRSKIVSFRGGYHGHTGLALAAGDPRYREPFGSTLPGFVQIPVFDLPALQEALTDDTAAFILETVPATLGMPLAPEGFMEAAERLCRERGVLLILDEVQTGLGRTGKLWGFQHYGVVPDIVVIGKGLSGGLYPISATIMRGDLDSVFHEDPFLHISTFGGSELGCRVARAVLDAVSVPEFLTRVNELSDGMSDALGRLQARHHRFFSGWRQLGLMIGLKFTDSADGLLVSRAAYANGLLMVYANNDPSVVQMLPPLNLPMEVIPEIEDRLDRTMRLARRMKPLARIAFGFRRTGTGTEAAR